MARRIRPYTEWRNAIIRDPIDSPSFIMLYHQVEPDPFSNFALLRDKLSFKTSGKDPEMFHPDPSQLKKPGSGSGSGLYFI